MDLQKPISRRTVLKGAAVGAGAFMLKDLVGPQLAQAVDSEVWSPSGRRSYAIPSLAQGVKIIPVLTVGETAENGYRLAGLLDGLGIWVDPGKINVAMYHEMAATLGAEHAHGSKGAFVSKWTLEPNTLRVLEGSDLIQKLYQWDTPNKAWKQETMALTRLCSADMAPPSAFQSGALGTADRIFLGGEEYTDGYAWASIATGPQAGESWALPRLGRFAWENAVASPHSKDKTIVVGLDDSALSTTASSTAYPCEVYFYIGTKQATGNVIEKAGLPNGKLYGVMVARNDGTKITEESNSFGLGSSTTDFMGRARFGLVELGPSGDVSGMNARQLEDESNTKGVFRFQRCEDGCWDPRPAFKNDFYFVTTASLDPRQNSRLWRLRFDDLDNPLAGGTIEILLRGGEGQRMFDNICMDFSGRIMLQEDTGNMPWVAKIWCYVPANGRFFEVAMHDPQLFEPNDPPRGAFITQDEESSGITDASGALGPGWFLFVVQSHKSSPDPELVEGGQLLALWVDPRLGISL
ncbi:MAG: hypothetical protein JW395_3250 [Nitrospira sp.]|nr:hypothetical protein [Nitrospira sp.]